MINLVKEFRVEVVFYGRSGGQKGLKITPRKIGLRDYTERVCTEKMPPMQQRSRP